MTKEEREKAIKVLDDMKVKIDIPKAAVMQHDKNWALDCAIKVLKQEPCDDCISREEVLSIYDEWFATCDRNGGYIPACSLRVGTSSAATAR